MHRVSHRGWDFPCIKYIDIHKPVDIERSDDLWKGEVLGNGARDTDLINGQVGVRGDDGTSREVHSLPHQVTTDTTLLGL